MKILWVEDNLRFVRAACRTLLAEHEVTVTPSVEDARGFLASEEFDVVMLDYDLADGKGDSIAHYLRHRKPRPFIVAVSAHDAGNAALQQAGADAVCGKLKFTAIEEILRTCQSER